MSAIISEDESSATAQVAVCEQANIVVSDLHLSEGVQLRVCARLAPHKRFSRWFRSLFGPVEPPPLITLDNPLEDFPHDRAFDEFLDRAVARHPAQEHVLHVNGDAFDPLVVTWFGRFEDPPYETAGVRKMRKIIGGHPGFFDALAKFARRPDVRLLFYVGNHDQFLVWPRVQREIVRRLTGGDPELAAKISFVGIPQRFKHVERGVLYYHGMNADPHNRVDPESAILTEDFMGRQLKRPVLNKPDGSYMIERVVNRLKVLNHLTGRVSRGRDMWMYAFLFRRWWGVYAGLAVAWDFIYRRIALWGAPRKPTMAETLKVVLYTIAEDSVDRLAERLLKERTDVKVVVMGHSHVWRRQSSSEGTYLNTGTWSLTYALFMGDKEVRWNRAVLKFCAQIAASLAVTILAGVLAPKGGWHLGPVTFTAWEAVASLFFLFALVFTIFPMSSDHPEVRQSSRLTFGLIRHYADQGCQADVMEYLPESKDIRECV
ncbi:metallophosphoesterase [Candidatus Uhrbacteria bacterium]|nr:metallophosphoesterase [Candidatus Uhrbacteria bacterium]